MSFNRRSMIKSAAKKVAISLWSLSLLTTPIALTYKVAYAENIQNATVSSLMEQLNIAKTRLMATAGDSASLGKSAAYRLKYKSDTLYYRYLILTYINKTGSANAQDILQHITTFNSRSTSNGNSYQIDSKNVVANIQKEMSDLKADILSLGTELNTALADINAKTSAADTNSVAKYLVANSFEVKTYFQTFKQYFDDYEVYLTASELGTYKASFASIYDSVVNKSTELNVDQISSLDVFNTTQAKPYMDPETDLFDPATKKFTSPMLSLIALSATFRPMHTNVNDSSTYDLVGEPEKAFHKIYGKKKKFLWMATKDTNNLTDDVNLKLNKSLRVVLLKDLLSQDDQTKVLYIDNQNYVDDSGLPLEVQEDKKSLNDKVKEQVAGYEKDLKEAKDQLAGLDVKNAVSDGVKKALDDKIADLTKKISDSAKEGAIKTAEILTGIPISSIFRSFNGKEPKNTPNIIQDVVFASADLNKSGYTTTDKAADLYPAINASQMTIQNIINHYSSLYSSIKLYRDMDRPVYIDIYGNIITSSGIVVLPAIANPMYYNPESPSYFFNLAFLESYPKFNLVDGSLRAAKGEDNKWSITKNFQNELHVDAVNSYSEFKATSKLGTVADKVSIIDETKSVKNVSTMWDLKDNMYLGKIGLNPITLVLDSKGDKKKVTIREVPNNESVLRILYVSNIQNIASIEKDTFIDNSRLKSEWMYQNITKVVMDTGISNLEDVNAKIPEVEKTKYENYLSLVTDLSENKFVSFLQNNQGNNIVYSKPINEIGVLYHLIPITYSLILFLSLLSSFVYIVLAAIIPESRLSHVLKIFGIIVLCSFLLSGVNTYMDSVVNYPIKKMYQNQLALWTLVDLERDAHQKELTADGTVGKMDDNNGIGMRLYKLPWDYPYKLAFTAIPSNQPLEEFYNQYMDNNDKYKYQHNVMSVKGDYLTSNTKELFNSSSVEPASDLDLGKQLKQNIYAAPELAYYLPYYSILDSLVYNLNLVTSMNNKMPFVIPYADGIEKTSGRFHYWVNSQLFIDSNLFKDSYKKYLTDTSDQDTEQHQSEVEGVEKFLGLYGDPTDFLGLRKILDTVPEKDLAPFTADGILNLKHTLWYPKAITGVKNTDKEPLIKEVNEDTKRFMLSLSDISDKVADEHLLKAVSLYASLDFNKKFSKYNGGNVPTDLEMDQIPLDRFIMSMIMPKEDLVKNSINSYYNFLGQKSGYVGVGLASINDALMILVNYSKPIIVVLIWALTAAMIYIKKIVIPDPDNRSIVNVIKLNLLYCGSSIAYLGLSYAIMWSTNFKANPAIYLLGSCFITMAYLSVLVFVGWAILKDSFYLTKGTAIEGARNVMSMLNRTLKVTMTNLPFIGSKSEGITSDMLKGLDTYETYLQQEAIRQTSSVGSVTSTTLVQAAKTTANNVTDFASKQEEKLRQRLNNSNTNASEDLNKQERLRDVD